MLFLRNKLHDFFGVLKESLKVKFRTCPIEGCKDETHIYGLDYMGRWVTLES